MSSNQLFRDACLQHGHTPKPDGLIPSDDPKFELVSGFQPFQKKQLSSAT